MPLTPLLRTLGTLPQIVRKVNALEAPLVCPSSVVPLPQRFTARPTLLGNFYAYRLQHADM